MYSMRAMQKITTNANILNTIKFGYNKNIYVNKLNISFFLRWINLNRLNKINNINNSLNLLNYYGLTLKKTHVRGLNLQINTKNCLVVFAKPRKQLFLILVKTQPIFIFTGGLMRLILNEKKKNSRKSYKVATSLIKLSLILTKKHYNQAILMLNRVGRIRVKIIKSFKKLINNSVINYIIIQVPIHLNNQKTNTRRSIKKYIKKRFNI